MTEFEKFLKQHDIVEEGSIRITVFQSRHYRDGWMLRGLKGLA